ncbi:acyltransferase family protein [Butyrivibrio sp. WCE2006]|uniref:acyltransferase family protein n=1 Tax=Butyrivibrio sp. WCE2006 TaxID=1410611 RepID=UPI0005D220EF|nr:acyltransferase family protein [Butyrivibrio sp. WCE2006]
MKEKSDNRSSNFELLRVLAMVMIIIHHIFVHCINIQLTDYSSMTRMDNGYFNNPIIFKRLWLSDFGSFFGPLGNAIFVLISGYFLVQKENVNMVKISKKLLSQLAFASVALIGGSFLWYRLTKLEVGRYVGLADISNFNTMSWYVGYYFMIILIGKLFLNSWLSKLDFKQYSEFLLIIFAMVEFGWTGALLDGLIPGLRTLGTGIFLYSFSGYIKKYDPLRRIKLPFIVLGGLFVICLICLSAYNVRSLSMENFEKFGGKIYIQVVTEYSNWHVLVIISGIMLFELFRRMKTFSSRIINFLGSSTFMIYLIHDNGVFYSLWEKTDWIYYWYNSTATFVINILKYAGLTFLIGVVAYIIYSCIDRVMYLKNRT